MDGQAVGVRAPVLIRPLPYWVVSTHREQAKRSTKGTLWGKGRGGGRLGQPRQSLTLAVANIRANGGVGWQQPLSMPSGVRPTLAPRMKSPAGPLSYIDSDQNNKTDLSYPILS